RVDALERALVALIRREREAADLAGPVRRLGGAVQHAPKQHVEPGDDQGQHQGSPERRLGGGREDSQLEPRVAPAGSHAGKSRRQDSRSRRCRSTKVCAAAGQGRGTERVRSLLIRIGTSASSPSARSGTSTVGSEKRLRLTFWFSPMFLARPAPSAVSMPVMSMPPPAVAAVKSHSGQRSQANPTVTPPNGKNGTRRRKNV